jgi:predicted TIM-barrel fold metal-dependent hydrolase
MIVDSHTHIKSSSGQIDTAAHLEACEKVDHCIVLASGDDKSRNVNQELGEYVKRSKKMIGFAVVNPLEDKVSIKEVTAMTKAIGLSGIVVYCPKHKFHPAHSRAMRLYETAGELNLPVFFHNAGPFTSDSVLDFARPYLLDEVARKFPSLKMVIGKMGIPFLQETLCLLSKHENIYADLSVAPSKIWEVYNIVTSAHEAGVMDKLLFGSGYPIADPSQCIEALLGFNKLLIEAHLPTVPREKIRNVIERDSLEALGISV